MPRSLERSLEMARMSLSLTIAPTMARQEFQADPDEPEKILDDLRDLEDPRRRS